MGGGRWLFQHDLYTKRAANGKYFSTFFSVSSLNQSLILSGLNFAKTEKRGIGGKVLDTTYFKLYSVKYIKTLSKGDFNRCNLTPIT